MYREDTAYPKPTKRKHNVPLSVKVFVWSRDSYRCRMCGKVAPIVYKDGIRIAWNPHHVHYRSQGGTDHNGNLILFCDDCHVPRAHQHRWMDEQLTKQQFMGRCFSEINSSYHHAEPMVNEWESYSYEQWVKSQPPLIGTGKSVLLEFDDGLIPVSEWVYKDVIDFGFKRVIEEKHGYNLEFLKDTSAAYYRVYLRETGKGEQIP